MKITKSELPNYLGERVEINQLDDIKDTYILLSDVDTTFKPNGLRVTVGTIHHYSNDRNLINRDIPNSTLVYKRSSNKHYN